MTSRHAARLLSALGVALSLTVPGLSRAQDDATIEMARQRFREGVQFYDQQKFEKARLAFLQAYALKPHPSVLLNLAQSELRSGHPDDAATHFSQYLHGNTSATDAERQETTAGFNSAKARVGEVSLTIDPSGSQVFVDGADKGAAPLAEPLYLMPGSHTIEARSGDRKASKSVTLSAGQSVTVAISVHGNMAAAGAPAAAETPAAEAPETAVEKPELKEEEEKPPPSAAPPPEPAEPAPTSGGSQGIVEWFADTPAAWVIAGVGVAGLGVGVGMAFVAKHDYSNANDIENTIIQNWQTPHNGKTDEQLAGAKSYPCSLTSAAVTAIGAGRAQDYADACQTYKSRVDSADTARTVAIVSTAVGGAALVGTVVYYFLDRKTESAPKTGGTGFEAHVLPVMGGGPTGIAIVGRF